MSPEPEVQVSYSEINGSHIENGGTISNCGDNLLESGESHESRKPRERRCVPLENFAEPPLSPASSSTSQANTTDVTFEPTIDMMVNDFDDEQTLNEEEALAAMEQKNPQDEIETLKEESEMPIEMLLAKYAMRAGAEVVAAPAATQKKSKKSNKKTKYKRNAESAPSNMQSSEVVEEFASSSSLLAESTVACSGEQVEENDVIVIESGDEETEAAIVSKSPEAADIEEESEEENVAKTNPESTAANCDPSSLQYQSKEKAKSRRSHLLDLYPDQAFDTVTGRDVGNAVPLEIIYGEDDEEEDDEAYEEEEGDNDYVKKTIMVGSSYQAVIPEGLSQYGDVLPYENEDKLIWEPSQVSEQEVEQYLLKARDMKPTLTEATTQGDDLMNKNLIGTSEGSSTNKIMAAATNNDEMNLQKNISDIKGGIDGDLGGVVKDNEQALHLLVQCGYDFKEALRRKRLNALPLTDTMSIWSEEECQKFEEGIQKFGKDFLKIRQNQVRTRTMRELVQFYYFWKKSDRRDHEFANADTVDHMDIYLNEGGDYGPNAGATGTCHTAGGTNVTLAISSAARKSTQKNFSIMTGNNINSSGITTTPTTTTASNGTHQIATNNTKVSNNRKRAVVTSGNSSGNGATFSTAITTNKSGNVLDTQSSNVMTTK